MPASKPPEPVNDAHQPPIGHLTGPVILPPGPLAPFATHPQDSRGRFHPESESATRTCYSRDRDRIVHSSAFRRLKHKTQVFVQHEGDYYRTRLTHSLEVAQLARSLARTLKADEDLAETVALAHDLGHTPFGHAGEEALDAVTRDIGGFDHNAHALRLVTKLEHRYADFDGLNLTWETLEGIVKHNGPLLAPSALRSFAFGASASACAPASAATGTSPADASHAGEADLSGGKKLAGPIESFDAKWPLDLATWPGIEAQLAALSDDIAYTNHDIDDGLRAGILTIADLAEAPLAGAHVRDVLARHGELELSRFVGELIRTLMGSLLDDLLMETRRRLAAAAPANAAAVRGAGQAMAAFSPARWEELKALKAFLFARMYRHPRVMTSMARAKGVVTDLYEAFLADPGLLPPDWAAVCGMAGDATTGRVARDYIAGMTDNYALEEYGRVFHNRIDL
jgi:dGTPase